MERIEEFSRNGKNFIYIDLSGFSTIGEFSSLTDQVKQVISKYPLNSVYTITHIENIRFDTSIKNHIAEYMRFNKPYVKCGVVTGIDGIKKIMVNTALKLSGRNNLTFCYTREEAIDILLKKE